jgi:ribosome-binding factor A
MKNRPARVRELILRELGALIAREFTFTAKLVTVQAVDLTADFKHCHVHVGVLGTPAEQKKAIGKLQEHRPLLQHELAKRVILKYTPQLHFHLDEALERGTKVMEIMRQIDEITPAEAALEDALPPAQTARAAQSVRAMAEEDEQLDEDLSGEVDDAELETQAVDADQAELEEELTEDDALAADSRHAKDAKVSKGVRGRGGKHEDPLADE